MDDKKKMWFQSALIRAGWTFLEALVGTMPAGFVITPAMIQYFNIEYVYIIIAWLATAALTAFVAMVKNHIVGIPEVDMMEYYKDADIRDEEEEDEDLGEGSEADQGV